MAENTAASKHDAQRSPIAEHVYERLIDMFISGEIAAGQRLSVDGLSRELQVSQTPIRRALTLLEADGLAHNSYLAGYTAAEKLTEEELDELFEVRLLIEPKAAALAAQRGTAEQFDEIEALSERMVVRDIGGNPMDYSAFARLDAQFHEAIVAAASNAMLLRNYVTIRAHVHLFRLRFHRTVTADAITEHAEILEALRSRDAGRAETAAREHLLQSHARLKRAFETP